MKAKLRWLTVLLVLLAGLSSAGVARAEPCLLSAPPLTGQSTTDWYLFVEFTSPEYVLVSFGPFTVSSDDDLVPLWQAFSYRIRAVGKVNLKGMVLANLIPEGAYLPIYTPQQFAQFDGAGGLNLTGMTSDLAAVSSGEPPEINNPTEGQNFNLKAGETFRFQVDARDPEGAPLYYNLTSYPSGMTMSSEGLILWSSKSDTPLGRKQIDLVVSDNPRFTCKTRRTFYVNVVAPPANPPTEPPPVTTPPTNNPPVVTPPVITPPTITPVPDKNNQGNQGNQGGQGNQGQQNPPAETNPAGGSQANPTGPVQTGAGQGTGTTSQPVSNPGNNNPGPVEVPVSGSNPEPGVVIPLEPDGGEPTGGENPPPSNNTDNTNSDAADLQEIQRQLDEIQNRVNELEDEVTRVLGDSSIIKPAEPASLGFLEIPPGFRFEQDLRRGDESGDVKYLQIVLNSDPDTQLTNSGPGSPGNETRNFGPLTESAVIRFQEKYAEKILHPIHYSHGTGFVGWRTREKLNEVLNGRLESGTSKRKDEITRGSSGRIQLGESSILSPDSALIRVLWGDPETVRQTVASIGLDFFVIGDIRDVAKEGWLFITRDPEFSPAVLGFAVLGIFTTGGPHDLVPSLGKQLAKYPEILKAGLRLVGAGKFDDAKALLELAKQPYFVRIATSQGTRLAKIIDEGGKEGIRYVQETSGKFSRTGLGLAENNPKHGLLHIWNDHIAEWKKLGINSPEQLKLVIQDVVKTGRAGLHRYPYQGGYEGQFWFYDQTRNIYVAVREEEGVWEIWTAFRPRAKWQHVENLKWMLEIK